MDEAITHEPAIMGGGELGELIRAFDWNTTSLGPPEKWPQSLKTCIRIMLTSSQPIWIGWGTELIKFYNDPYKAIVGGKHPWALGKPASLVWKDIWNDIEPMLDKVMKHNQGIYVESQLLIMERNGYPEETYYTFSYTPIPGDDGNTAGMFCANTDDTYKIITERQLKTLTELGKTLISTYTHEEVIRDSIAILEQNPQDFPFAIFRTLEDDKATLSYTTPLGDAENIVQKEIHLRQKNQFSDILNKAIIEKKFQLVDNVKERFGELPKGAWPVNPDKLLVMPVIPTGAKEPYGLLIFGINPYRLVDEKCLDFYSLVADQIATSLSQVQVLEDERKRAKALAEIDKAKTVFFSNISHEFRTPITLMLGTIEESLNDSNTTSANLQRMDVAHRNAMRLLKLVNNLLDFSRIESGKTKANFQLTDIAQFTAELASGFQSAIENAGLKFVFTSDESIQPTYVDRSMWEKIVLNLLSNAFKYTLQGSIKVNVSQQGPSMVLTVKDTGVGIPEEELPKMFQRFHRVHNVTGRTHEGTGIGLSLIYELIQLHGGNIKVSSEVEKGSVFTVTIPVGKEHLPADQIVHGDENYEARLADVFIEEAASIIDNDEESAIMAGESNRVDGHKVLIVDDNPDMRQYLRQILSKHFIVLTATNGIEALKVMNENLPHLVLSDVMMPEMDGAELLKNIKAESKWQHVPVILLSARAGEEARIEGYETGADDYLVKPFSSKELLSRIKSHLQLSEQRQVEKNRLKQLLRQAPVGMCLLRGPNFIVEVANAKMLALWGKTEEQMLEKPLNVGLPEIKNQGFEELLANVFSKGEAFVGEETPVMLFRNGNLEQAFFNFVYEPLYELDNTISGVVAVATEVTEQLLSREKIRESEQRYATTVFASNLGLWDFDVLQQKVVASGKMAEIYGLADNSEYTTEHLLKAIHPDDKKEQDELFTSILEGKVTSSFQTEYRIRQQDTNIIKWIRATGKAFFNEEGILYRTVGTVSDITAERVAEQKRMEVENELKQSEERFRALVTASSDVVYRMNAGWSEMRELKGRGFLTDTGEPISNWIEKYIHPDDVAFVQHNIDEAIDKRKIFELEHQVLQADGTRGWTLSRAVPILDDKGEIIEWFGAATDITPRRKTAELVNAIRDELEASKRLYEAVTNSTPDLIYVWDLNYKFIYANKALLNMWGRTWEESEGKSLLEVGYEPWHAEMHEREIDEVVATKSIIRGEVSFPHATLGKRIYDYILAPVFDEDGEVVTVAGTTRDISDLKKAEEAVKRSEEQFRTLTQSLPQLIWTADKDGNRDFFNQQWYDYTGGSPEESSGNIWESFVHPHHQKKLHAKWLACIKEGKPLTYEFQLRAHDGTYNWFYVLGNPIKDVHGNIQKWVGALTNIDEQKAVEEKLERLVQERTRELQRSNEDLLQFAHVASHDLKEPVRKVKTFTSRLEKDPDTVLSNKAKEYLNKIYSASDRMYYMIEGVLAYSTINKIEQDFSPVDLHEIIRNIESDLEVSIQQHNASIICEELPTIEGVPVLIYQLFYNLINNSLKFARENEPPVISVSSRYLPGDLLEIKVSDNGIGFEQEYAERVFHMFSRLHSKDKYEGTGLGLALCKKIVERHHGTIDATGEKGKGATFTITLPGNVQR